MLKRNRRKQTITLNERLAIHAQKAREDLATLPGGEQQDDLIQKIREIELAISFNRALGKKE
jgi:ABC-type sugar transport system ATPase subunit